MLLLAVVLLIASSYSNNIGMFDTMQYLTCPLLLQKIRIIPVSHPSGLPVPSWEPTINMSSLLIRVAISSPSLHTPSLTLLLFQESPISHMVFRDTEVKSLKWRKWLSRTRILVDQTDRQNGNYLFSRNSDLRSDKFVDPFSGISCSRSNIPPPLKLIR